MLEPLFTDEDTAQDRADVLAALALYEGEAAGQWFADRYVGLVHDLVEKHPPEDTTLAIDVFEMLATNRHPQVRSSTTMFIGLLLGRGIERVEEIVWRKLVQDEDPAVASHISQHLQDHLRRETSSIPPRTSGSG